MSFQSALNFKQRTNWEKIKSAKILKLKIRKKKLCKFMLRFAEVGLFLNVQQKGGCGRVQLWVIKSLLS